MKKTKIVSTLGPSTDSKQKIEELIEAGVNVARLNFSHVSHKEHGESYDRIRETSEKIAIMADTKGPEIRLGEVKEGTKLEKGEKIEIKTGNQKSNEKTLYVTYKDFVKNIEIGDEIRIDDGLIELEAVKVNENSVECKIIYGGEISDRKAVNVPGKDIGLSAPTKKDVKDIEFAAKKGFDFISLSFVKKAEDVEKVREILEENNSNADIISKIEHAKAVENFDEILEASDAIMVARGDLGVEMPASKLPGLQKEMIEKSNKAGKPVITATQMLESMTENPTATRAEISDVANAVMDGTDAVMLSGETAVGEYPVKTVEFMAEIVQEVEESLSEEVHHTVKHKSTNTTETVCKNVWQTTRDQEIDLIITHTRSGSTARNMSKYRPEKPVIAFTDDKQTERKLQLAWGVRPYYQNFTEDVERMIEKSGRKTLDLGIGEETDTAVITAGIPTLETGTTNMMQIRELEDLVE